MTRTGSGPADPFPDLDRPGPFPDLEPDEDELAPPPSPVTRAAAARPEVVMPGLIRSRRKPKRTLVIIAAALTLPLALGVGRTALVVV